MSIANLLNQVGIKRSELVAAVETAIAALTADPPPDDYRKGALEVADTLDLCGTALQRLSGEVRERETRLSSREWGMN